jgi:hypothetical protein
MERRLRRRRRSRVGPPQLHRGGETPQRSDLPERASSGGRRIRWIPEPRCHRRKALRGTPPRRQTSSGVPGCQSQQHPEPKREEPHEQGRHRCPGRGHVASQQPVYVYLGETEPPGIMLTAPAMVPAHGSAGRPRRAGMPLPTSPRRTAPGLRHPSGHAQGNRHQHAPASSRVLADCLKESRDAPFC